MRIINALMANWKTKTLEEKIKTVLHGIAIIGGGAIGSTIGDRCAAGRNRLEGACAKVTGWALGGAIGDTAAKAMDETVDQISGLLKERQNKEDAANA